MLNETTGGVFVIAITPFDETGAIDYPSVDLLVDFYLSHGVHGITVLGMMGEAHKLAPSESESLVRYLLARVAGRVPVGVGVSGGSFTVMRALTRQALDAGAAAVMIAPTPGLRTDEQLYAYYAQVFETLGSDVPCIYQDYPQSTGVYLSPAVLLRLIRDFPQLVLWKAEDCPGLGNLTRVRQESERQGLRRIGILTGNGGFYFPQALSRGADGVMTGFAFPDMLVRVYQRFVAGDRDGAEDEFDRFAALICYENQPGYGLAVRKEILRQRGAIRTAAVRAPGARLTDTDRQEIARLLARVDRDPPRR
jgi:4-hydroxy-tetrahydrodipicolinate synthase